MADYKAAIDLLLLGITHEHDNLTAFYEQTADVLRLVVDDFDDDVPHFPAPEILPAGPGPEPAPVLILVPLMAPGEEEERPRRREIFEYRELIRVNGNLDLELPFLPARRIGRVVVMPPAAADAEAGVDGDGDADLGVEAGTEGWGKVRRSFEFVFDRRERGDGAKDDEADYEADEEEEDDARELAEEEAPETEGEEGEEEEGEEEEGEEEEGDWEHIPRFAHETSASPESNPDRNDSPTSSSSSTFSESTTWSTNVHIKQEQEQEQGQRHEKREEREDQEQESLAAKLWTLFDFCRAFVVASSRELAEKKPSAAQRPRSFLEVFG